MALQDILNIIDNLKEFDKPETIDLIAGLTEQELIDAYNHPTVLRACVKRIRNLENRLCQTFTGKNQIIRLMLACTLAQVPMVLLGPPGTAKSKLIRSLCKYLGVGIKRGNAREYQKVLREALAKARQLQAAGHAGNGTHGGNGHGQSGGRVPLGDDAPIGPAGPNAQDKLEHLLKNLRVGERPLFEYLVTRYTTPEEILGATNIDALLTFSLFFRESEGMLPHTQVAFLDEIFKANSAILNSLLSIMNERVYYNAGQPFKVDLLMVFGASNEAPDGQELGALYDRFPIRAVCDSVRSEDARDMLRNSLKLAYDESVKRGAPDDPLDPIEREALTLPSMNHFRLLSRMRYVAFGADTFFDGPPQPTGFDCPSEFVNMFVQFRDEFGISDRTPERLYRVATSMAMLDYRNVLEPDDLQVFQYVAPNVDSARVLEQVVKDIIDGIKKANANP